MSTRWVLAFLAGALFNLAGVIEIAGGLFSRGTMRTGLVSVGAMFLACGSLWIAIGARWKRSGK